MDTRDATTSLAEDLKELTIERTVTKALKVMKTSDCVMFSSHYSICYWKVFFYALIKQFMFQAGGREQYLETCHPYLAQTELVPS